MYKYYMDYCCLWGIDVPTVEVVVGPLKATMTNYDNNGWSLEVVGDIPTTGSMEWGKGKTGKKGNMIALFRQIKDAMREYGIKEVEFMAAEGCDCLQRVYQRIADRLNMVTYLDPDGDPIHVFKI